LNERQIVRIVVKSALLIALIGLVLWFAWTVRAVLILFLVAGILATGLTPIVDAFAGIRPARRRFRMERGPATLLIFVLLIGALILTLIGVVPTLIAEFQGFAAALPAYVGQANETLRALGREYPLLAGLSERMMPTADAVAADIEAITYQAGTILQVAASIVSGFISFTLLLIVTFYLIVDGERIRRQLVWLLPPANRPAASAVAEAAQDKIGAWLIGQFALSAIIGVFSLVGLEIIGVPYALFLAAIAAIGELVPMIGPYIGAVPAVIVALFVSPFTALLTIGLYILIQQLENNLVVPQVMRRAVDLPPVFVLAALMLGSEALGIVGALLAVPVAAIVSIIVAELIDQRHIPPENREPGGINQSGENESIS
jgi:predicted PurR-regulated permease PerM